MSWMDVGKFAVLGFVAVIYSGLAARLIYQAKAEAQGTSKDE